MLRRIFSVWIFLMLSALFCFSQANFNPPIVTGTTGLGVAWTAGTVNNGGHPVSVTAGTGTLTASQNSCASAAFSACNFVYVNSSGTVANTTTAATAAAAGNTLLAYVETGTSTITQIVYPWQAGSMWTGIPQGVLASQNTIGLGSNGGSSGVLNLSGSTSGTVTVQPQAVAGTYNFNLPTGAGTSGAPLLSQGGSTSAQIYPSSALFTGTGGATLTLGLASTATGDLALSGTTSGTVSILPQAAAGTYNFNLPTAAGTTGAPLLSQGGGSTAQIYGNNALFTGTSGSTLTLGSSGTVAGNIALVNATSGTITIAPPTGALGTPSLTLPINAGGLSPVLSCGSTGTGNQTCSPAAATGKTQIYVGESTLSSNAATITFPNTFTSSTSYFCVANDVTTRANPVQMIPASGTTATITNTTGASDVIQWTCLGN